MHTLYYAFLLSFLSFHPPCIFLLSVVTPYIFRWTNKNTSPCHLLIILFNSYLRSYEVKTWRSSCRNLELTKNKDGDKDITTVSLRIVRSTVGYLLKPVPYLIVAIAKGPSIPSLISLLKISEVKSFQVRNYKFINVIRHLISRLYNLKNRVRITFNSITTVFL